MVLVVRLVFSYPGDGIWRRGYGLSEVYRTLISISRCMKFLRCPKLDHTRYRSVGEMSVARDLLGSMSRVVIRKRVSSPLSILASSL